MAIGQYAKWWVRSGGNDANGAAFDSTISGAGTDYSQQDAPAMNVSDIASANSTTFTSAAGLFTSAMVGNAMRLTGGGATSGYYFMVSYTNSTTAVFDRAPGTVAGGTGRLGGAAANLARVLDSANAVGDKVVAGNVIYVRGAGSDLPGTADYTYSTYFTPVGGTTTSIIRVIGENGRPRFDGSTDLFLYNASWQRYENLMIKVGANNFGSVVAVAVGSVIRNCLFHLNDTVGSAVSGASDGSTIEYNEIFGKASSPTLKTGSWAIQMGGIGSCVRGNTIYCTGGTGIYNGGQYYGVCEDNLIIGVKEKGIHQPAPFSGAIIRHNTVDGAGSDGIYVLSQSALSSTDIHRNLITNNGGFGINVGTGSTSDNDALKRADYNGFFNNTSGNYSNCSATNSPNDVSYTTSPYNQGNPSTNWYQLARLYGAQQLLSLLSGLSNNVTYFDFGALQSPRNTGAIANNWSGGLRPRAFAPGLAR